MKTRKPKLPEVTKTLSDPKGNLLICKNNGKRIIVTLKLLSEKKGRRIGIVNAKRKVFDVRRIREKHLFKKFQGYGFNHKLLADAKLFDKVRLTDNYGQWLIPKEFILESKKYLNFEKSGGFELQVFVSLEEIEQFKRETIV
jgi:hypothetical protein